MAKRTRDVPVLFWVSRQEMDQIREKMEQSGISNLSAYLRSMALDGHVVRVEVPELKEVVALLRRSSSELDRLSRSVQQSGSLRPDALAQITLRQEDLWNGIRQILEHLAAVS